MADLTVYAWLDHARADLRVATEILQPDWDFIAVVLFLAPQCAEKALKALLSYRGVRIPRTHNLVRLRTELDDPEITALMLEVETYSDFATVFRYPGDEDEPGIEEARQAVEQVRWLYAAILERIPEELRPVRHA